MYDVLVDFYKTIIPIYQLPINPMAGIKRPKLPGGSGSQPHPLKSEWLPDLMKAAETDNEMAALLFELGAGWRPWREFTRIEAVDVREALNRDCPLMLVHGKQRNELTPVLPEGLEILRRLTPKGLKDHDVIIRSRQVRDGLAQPMGAKAHTAMIYRLFRRADIPDGFVPYDLRDTFATLVYQASQDWFLTERLLRHVLPGEGKQYIRFPLEQLCDALERFSPLR